MALKDTLAMLQEAAAKSQTRMAEDNAAISSYQSAMSMPSVESPALGGGGGGPLGGGSNAGGRLGAFLNAISDQESGGNYGAVNSSSGALGKYQVMPSNVAGWSKQVLGHSISPQQFLHNPKMQEKVVRGILGNYFKQYGAAGAAKAWYAGPDDWNTSSNAPQYGGPSINAYASSVLKHMRKYL